MFGAVFVCVFYLDLVNFVFVMALFIIDSLKGFTLCPFRWFIVTILGLMGVFFFTMMSNVGTYQDQVISFLRNPRITNRSPEEGGVSQAPADTGLPRLQLTPRTLNEVEEGEDSSIEKCGSAITKGQDIHGQEGSGVTAQGHGSGSSGDVVPEVLRSSSDRVEKSLRTPQEGGLDSTVQDQRLSPLGAPQECEESQDSRAVRPLFRGNPNLSSDLIPQGQAQPEALPAAE